MKKLLILAVALTLLLAACAAPAAEITTEYTLEELGETIVAAGEFWNQWWASHPTFEWEHIDDSRRNWQPWDPDITPAEHPLSRGYAVLLPSSGFASLDDLSAHLSQFYTQRWIDISGQGFAESRVDTRTTDGTDTAIFGINRTFEGFDGELFVFIQTEWSARPDWSTAVHTLTGRDGNRAFVETVVAADDVAGGGGEFTYRFTFIDGKIHTGTGEWRAAGVPQEPTTVTQATTAVYEQTTLTAEVVPANTPADVVVELSSEEGTNLLVRAEIDMHSLALFMPLYDDDLRITPERGEEIAGLLAVGSTLLLQNYRGAGTLPNAGLTFTDSEGVQRYFVLVVNNAYPQHGPMFWFNEVSPS